MLQTRNQMKATIGKGEINALLVLRWILYPENEFCPLQTSIALSQFTDLLYNFRVPYSYSTYRNPTQSYAEYGNTMFVQPTKQIIRFIV